MHCFTLCFSVSDAAQAYLWRDVNEVLRDELNHTNCRDNADSASRMIRSTIVPAGSMEWIMSNASPAHTLRYATSFFSFATAYLDFAALFPAKYSWRSFQSFDIAF